MTIIKLWIDDIRTPPSNEWVWAKTVNEARAAIRFYEHNINADIIIISLDHDAGAYYSGGGDYIKVLDWLEEENLVDTGYFFHFHSMNPVGVENMRRIINHNNWREVKSL